MKWRTDTPCVDCPFNKSGPGLHLRKSLRPSRWRGILWDLRREKIFTCHKTTEETGNGTNLACAGSIEWQNKRGIETNFQRVMERVDAIFGKESK